MFLPSLKQDNYSVVRLTQILHFLRLHQMVYQLTLVLCILFFSPPADLFSILTACVMLVLITPTFLLVQDILGKKDDEQANQKRILFSDKVNKIFFYSALVIMSMLLILNNLESLICFGLLFITTLSYAAAKHYRKMILSYTGRYLSSVCTILLYVYILAGYVPTSYYLFIFLVSVLDLVGNIAGDIRDVQKDFKVGVKTLVTKYSKDNTLQIMSLFVIGIFGIIIIHYQSILLLTVMVANTVPFLVIDQVPTKITHGVFHVAKLINFIVVAGLLTSLSIFIVLTTVGIIVSLWSLAYYFYLYNAGHPTHA